MEELLGGRYALGTLLGSGGSAAVFAARDTRLGRQVAVKVLHAHLALRPGVVADLLAEARVAARLDHPNVVHVLDAGTGQHGLAWIVLELVDGITLAELVARAGPLPAADALVVTAGMLAGLAHAHAAGVLHLDLSPANVMMPRAPGGFDLTGARLLDLGSCPRLDGPDLLVRVSPHYASPEVATAEVADARADVYAAGAILFFLVTGRAPFERADARAVLEAHVHERPPVPSSLVPGLASEVDRLVARALAKDPEDRFASAPAMGVEVERARAGIAARRTPAAGGTRAFVPVQRRTAMEPRPAAAFPAEPGGTGIAAALTTALIVIGLVVGAVALGQPGGGEVRPPALAALAASPTPTGPIPQPTAPAPLVGAPVVATEPPQPQVELVPALAGLTLAAASDALLAAGLVAGVVEQVDSRVPGNTVLSSGPAMGTSIPRGSSVALVVASGLDIVPDVVGLRRAVARAWLEEAGFVVVERESGSGPPGTAVRTEPVGGTRGTVGGTVVLSVAADAGQGPAQPNPNPAPPSAPSPTAAPTAIPGSVTSANCSSCARP